MPRFLIHWATVALSLWVATEIVPGIRVSSFTVLVIGALILGLINACVRPVLVFLTLPITVVTLGFFYLVVNGLSFGLAAWLGQRATSVTYAPLYASLPSEEASTVAAKLKELKVPYRVVEGGRVEVPEERVPELRLEMAAPGRVVDRRSGCRWPACWMACCG